MFFELKEEETASGSVKRVSDHQSSEQCTDVGKSCEPTHRSEKNSNIDTCAIKKTLSRD